MTQILSQISNPGDLQKLTATELDQLAKEIREVIIQTTSENGGHLAPNLGVVELTLALHLVFQSPKDKIIWDVGHQSYVHKLLTGRYNNFHTLRRYKGMAGFPKRSESEHDIFNTGHSSTSISAALGFAFARDLKKEEGAVIAVIGDGALTGGIALEALNHAGHAGNDMIVVLNDNEKSIADNVGAMSTYLSRIRTDPRYFRNKEEVEEIVRRIPSIGSHVLKVMEKMKDGFKHLVVPGILFEELGFSYLGPIDGHNLGQLREVMTNACRLKGPILVHVLTKKGKGYAPAETNPSVFHGVGPFDVETGKVKKNPGPPTYTQVFSDTLLRLAREDERIVGVTAAMPDGTGMTPFARAFPSRFFDVGIAEQHAVNMSAALALQGLRPVVAIYSTFLQRAYDQVFHDVCLQRAPVVFAIDRGGIVGDDGETHHGLFDIAFLRHIPELVMMAPKDENELQHMLHTALEYEGPVAVRYPRGTGVGVTLDEELTMVPIGKGELLRQGSDLTIVAIGAMVGIAEEAADLLEAEGIRAAVVNARFVKPLDKELIVKQARETGKIVTVEEHVLAGGFGSAILELLEMEGVHCSVRRIGIPDEYVQHGTVSVLREDYGLTASNVARVARELADTDRSWASIRKAPPAPIKIAFRGESR
ncbi:1-deoxy-D-xylulose-5-phosphate synthase [Heliobacterium undosum]|uniref:1-deoxy-D-xylulose-5-phosphate synthase n=1 Tax=Heliomicrobium undosum TaxID=121734 RepID=A0A845L0K3_9FIRM|nr:1-deoxy-D-xylulose-5-phosphate synthase [Heliomicrobium undosum]MZP28445.1 1-deoxy-D-xylulose-5-phosphate synthase [Heliomicrobium undosum]